MRQNATYNTNKMSYYEKTRDDINGFFWHAGDMTFRPHFHRSIELMLTDDGALLDVTVNRDRRILSSPCFVLIDSYDVHSFCGGNEKCRSMILPPTFTENFRKQKGNRALGGNFITDVSFVRRILPLFDALPTLTDNALAFSGAVDLLLALSAQQLGWTQDNDSGQNVARGILDHLENHYAEKLTLSSVAEKMGYHPCYLSKILHEYCNDSFNNVLNAIRYRAFVDLQQRNDDLLTNIFAAGFNSVSTFYRYCNQMHLPKKPQNSSAVPTSRK